MALAIDLSDHQAQALAEAAARLQISETDLAAAAVRDLIAQPADDFNAAAQRVLSKNAELYRRVARTAGSGAPGGFPRPAKAELCRC
jgi:hypothetical protein